MKDSNFSTNGPPFLSNLVNVDGDMLTVSVICLNRYMSWHHAFLESNPLYSLYGHASFRAATFHCKHLG